MAVARRGHDRRALRHGLEHREAEPFEQARDSRTPPPPAYSARRSASATKPRRWRRSPSSTRAGGELLLPPGRAHQHQVEVGPGQPAEAVDDGRARSCGARACRPRARTADRGRGGSATSATDAGSARVWSTPHGTMRTRAGSMPALTAVGRGGLRRAHDDRRPARRVSCTLRRKNRTPWRVKNSGQRSQARSCTVTTSGARRRRHGQPGGVDDVDRTGRPLDRRPPQPVPRLVERGGAERQRAHGDRRDRRPGGRPAVAGAHPDLLDVEVGRPPPRAVCSTAARATPPGTRCQHCSRVTATRSGAPATGPVTGARRWRKYSVVRSRPSRRSTSGAQPSRSRASVMSGRRWVGSSTGQGLEDDLRRRRR